MVHVPFLSHAGHLRKSWGVLGEVLVRVSILDGMGRVAGGERLGAGLAIDVVLSAGDLGEVGRLVDKSSRLNN